MTGYATDSQDSRIKGVKLKKLANHSRARRGGSRSGKGASGQAISFQPSATSFQHKLFVFTGDEFESPAISR